MAYYKRPINRGKKKGNNPSQFQSEVRIKLPKRDQGEMFGIVTLMSGTEFLKVLCEDEKERAIRIPGKMRNRVWIKENDVVIVKPWEYEDHKGDFVWRFLPLQVQRLKREGHLGKLPI